MAIQSRHSSPVSAAHLVKGLDYLRDLRMRLRLALPARAAQQRPDTADSLLQSCTLKGS